MTSNEIDWIISYDIRCPKRLQRVNKFCKQIAMPFQYSVFVTKATNKQIIQISKKIERIINLNEDEIKIYPVGKLEKMCYSLNNTPQSNILNFTLLQ